MTRTLLSLTIATAAAVAAVTALATNEAHAGRGGSSQIYQQTYEFKQPMHGYEGRSPLLPHKYCTYKRFPKRACAVDRNGYEKCRIVGWELEQTCY
ncbi:MAG: hypothetical protein NW205_12850 [Hyphomicrobiaceae bacterium]|nr:hypothetical protein [Hyphomicrobiaceae bacterium]